MSQDVVQLGIAVGGSGRRELNDQPVHPPRRHPVYIGLFTTTTRVRSARRRGSGKLGK